jgi:signal transduction histidine kinase
MAAEGWRARVATVRVRTTAAAVLVVGAAMVVGAVVLVTVLRSTLTDEVRTATRLRADDVAALIEASAEPDAMPVGDADDLFVQVVGPDGALVAASPEAEGSGPIDDLRPGESRLVEVETDDDAYLAVAVAAETEAGPRTVIAARTLEERDETVRTVALGLALGIPVLLIVVGATTWFVVGRALAPVDAMRREVDEISAAELHRRVPTPGSSDEIGRLARTLNRMLDRLEQAQARQQRFVSDASHELRSPVASIRQHAEVARAHPDRMRVEDLAETVLAEDLRVQRLVEDLLLLARLDERPGLGRRAVDLDDLVFEEADRLRHETGLHIDSTAVSAGRVEGDRAALRRALRNLGDNAGRHAHGRVALSLAERDGSVALTVDDDGSGIPEAERERVLERFVRLDEARDRDAGGSGLGLAIVAEVVRAHGGTVTITDSALGGARVEVTFPMPRL